MEGVDETEFSGGDASYFIAVVQEWHTTNQADDRFELAAIFNKTHWSSNVEMTRASYDLDQLRSSFFNAPVICILSSNEFLENGSNLNVRTTVSWALSRLHGEAEAWASHSLPPETMASAEAFMAAMAKRWPPMASIPCKELHHGLRQKAGQTVQEFITEISYRCMQHILVDCRCCETYLPIDDVYDKPTAMAYDILVRGVSFQLWPWLTMTLNPGSQRFSQSKKLLRIAAGNAETMLKSRLGIPSSSASQPDPTPNSDDTSGCRNPDLASETTECSNVSNDSRQKFQSNARSAAVADLESILDPPFLQLNPKNLEDDLKSVQSASTACSAAAPSRPQLSDLSHSEAHLQDCVGRQSQNQRDSHGTGQSSRDSQSHMESQAYLQVWLEHERNSSSEVHTAKAKVKPKDTSCKFQCCTWLMVTLIMILLLVPVAYYAYQIVKPILRIEYEGDNFDESTELWSLMEDEIIN